MKPDYRKYPHKWQRDDSYLSRTDKLLWNVINDYQGRNKWAWPSQQRLAEDLGCTSRLVQYSIRKMRDARYLTVQRNRVTGASRNRYQVTHPLFGEDEKSFGFEGETGYGTNTKPVAGSSSYELTQGNLSTPSHHTEDPDEGPHWIRIEVPDDPEDSESHYIEIPDEETT